LKFGVEIEPFQGWLDHLKLAEDLGFEYAWYAADYQYADSFSALAYAATKTRNVKLGSMCNAVYARHPVFIASGISTVDEVSKGRAVLGLASAGYEITVKLGVDAKEPLKATREAVHVIKSLWRGGPVNYSGELYYLKDVKLPYKVREDIPIYLATRGAKFELAGALCDGSITHGKTTEYVNKMVKKVREGAKKAGRTLKDFDVTTVVPFKITDNVEAAKKELKPLMAAFIGCEYSLDWIKSLGISVEEVKPIREAVRDRKFSKSVNLVSDKLLNKLVDAYCVVGSAEECVSQIEGLEKAGLTQIIPMMCYSTDVQNIHAQIQNFDKEMRGWLKVFGREIIQRLKE
jgi:5,10-methylenetetrahydromethanopterin reductase